jgi:hypothetical protein
LPRLPPTLPDCACARPHPNTTGINMERRAIRTDRATNGMRSCFQCRIKDFSGRTHRHRPRQ